MNAKKILVLAKALLSISLISYLVYYAASLDLTDRLSNITYSYFILAIAAHAFAYLSLLMRWKEMLSIHKTYQAKHLFQSYYIGVFSNNFLPTNFGGDLVRAALLIKNGVPRHAIAFSIFSDRLIGFIVVITFGGIAGLFITNNININIPTEISLTYPLIASVILLIALLIYKTRIIQSEKVTARVKTIKNEFLSMKLLADQLVRNPKVLTISLLYGALSTALIIETYLFLALSLDLEIPRKLLYVAIPISFMASAIPVSIGGLGVREASVVFLLSSLEVNQADAVSLTLAYLAVLLCISSPGGIILMVYKSQKNLTEKGYPGN